MMVRDRRKRIKYKISCGWKKKSLFPPIVTVAISPAVRRIGDHKSRNTSGRKDDRNSGSLKEWVGAPHSGSPCSHIYYPGSRTGTNELLIVRVRCGIHWDRGAMAPLCTGRRRPYEATCYIDSRWPPSSFTVQHCVKRKKNVRRCAGRERFPRAREGNRAAYSSYFFLLRESISR